MPDHLDITIDGGTTASRPSLVRAHLMPQPLEHSCTPACTCVSRWSGRTHMQLTPANADVRASQAVSAIWELASIGEFEALPRRTGTELTRARKVSGLGPSRPLRLRACRASPDPPCTPTPRARSIHGPCAPLRRPTYIVCVCRAQCQDRARVVHQGRRFAAWCGHVKARRTSVPAKAPPRRPARR